MFVNLLCVALDAFLVISYFIEVRCIGLGMKTEFGVWLSLILAILWIGCTIAAVGRIISGDTNWMNVMLVVLAGIMVVLRVPATVEQLDFLQNHKK